MQILKSVLLLFAVPFVAVAGNVSVKSVTVQQQHPWNGLVDIIVTIQGTAGAVAEADCSFAATNSATQVGIPVVHITRNGDDLGSGSVWTRKFIWDAKADVGAMKIDDVALTVDFKSLGGVQLWENGPYWAKRNVGATQPEECGYYFWWGDTVGYKRNANNNGWISVKDSTSFSFSSGNCQTDGKESSQLQSDGYIDATGNLVSARDAATAHHGAPWRMPTDAEIATLVRKCTFSWTTRNGVKGYLVTGKGAYSSKSIFLPAAGDGLGLDLNYLGSYGNYWSSTSDSDHSDSAWFLDFGSSYIYQSLSNRSFGYPVRPIRGFAGLSGATGGATTHLSLDCLILFCCTVGFDPNGGSCSTASRSYVSGDLIGALPEATRSGYMFDGWYTAASGGTKVSTETIVTASVTLYAHWAIFVSNVEAQQRYPWNGLVDISVTIQGAAEDVVEAVCLFAATNSATKDALPVAHITQNGTVTGSETVWTRKFIWDTNEDLGEVKIDDVELTVDVGWFGGVQLWENGPYWAECNVGATKPEEYGYYFTWGDTDGHVRNASNDGWISVKSPLDFSDGEGKINTIGCANSKLKELGCIDSANNLVAAYDAATAHLGLPWRMPTDAEVAALVNNCTATWTTRNGVAGRLVTGKGAYASKSIFLPATGSGSESYLYGSGSNGPYWSSTPNSEYPWDKAWELDFDSSDIVRKDTYRIYRFPVRPVRGFAR